MYNSFEQRLRIVEDKNALKGVNLNELNLVLDLVIPSGFKTMNFEKYDGTTCPEIPLKIAQPSKDKVQALIDADLARFQELLRGYQG